MKTLIAIAPYDVWLMIGKFVENPFVLRQVCREWKVLIDGEKTYCYKEIFLQIQQITHKDWGGEGEGCSALVRRAFNYLHCINHLFRRPSLVVSEKAVSLIQIFKEEVAQHDAFFAPMRRDYLPRQGVNRTYLGNYIHPFLPPEVSTQDVERGFYITGVVSRELAENLSHQKKMYLQSPIMQSMPCFKYLEKVWIVEFECMKMISSMRI